MRNYVGMNDYAKILGIAKDEVVFLSSDTVTMLTDALENGEATDLNLFIDGLQNAVGKGGTIVFPTYNWDFCKGLSFDYRKTKSRTGSLGTVALKRRDFIRTRHPIYSFAVWGKYKDYLYSMQNTSSFGIDSPFTFLKDYAINYVLDVELNNCFTMLHYAEQQSGVVKYRFEKNFTAKYFDESGSGDVRTYSMFVRKLDLDVQSIPECIEQDFIKKGAEKVLAVNNSVIKRIVLKDAHEIMLDDLRSNSGMKVVKYIGQR